MIWVEKQINTRFKAQESIQFVYIYLWVTYKNGTQTISPVNKNLNESFNKKKKKEENDDYYNQRHIQQV